jgi:hypothetical protein
MTPVDVLDAEGRFVTSATCELTEQLTEERWTGLLTGVEPNKRLVSGRYRLRTRDGVEVDIFVRARQRIGSRERYPFLGEGRPPALEPA